MQTLLYLRKMSFVALIGGQPWLSLSPVLGECQEFLNLLGILYQTRNCYIHSGLVWSILRGSFLGIMVHECF